MNLDGLECAQPDLQSLFKKSARLTWPIPRVRANHTGQRFPADLGRRMCGVGVGVRGEQARERFMTSTRCLGYGNVYADRLSFRTTTSEGEDDVDGLGELTVGDDFTRLGLVLRNTGLDELPQLFNVLRGEMSLVGPLPIHPDDFASIERFAPERVAQRHRVLPGLTGPSQVSGRAEVGLEQMLHLDLEYINRWSIGVDGWIIYRTFHTVLLSRRAA